MLPLPTNSLTEPKRSMVRRSPLAAHAQVLLQRAGRDVAFERGTQLIVYAGVVGAAVIVDVVFALRAEEVRRGDVGATCRAITAPGECREIVDLRATARCFGGGAPVVVELVGVTQLRVERIHFHRPRPRLVAEQAVHIDIARYLRAAQQLIAGAPSAVAGADTPRPAATAPAG